MYAWGYNNRGQLGDGTLTDRTRPVAVNTAGTPMAGKVITQIDGGQDHTIAGDSAGNLYSWGANFRGQLGDGTETDRSRPVAVNIPALGAGYYLPNLGNSMHSSAVSGAGTLYMWGQNADGQQGYGGTCYCGRATPWVLTIPWS